MAQNLLITGAAGYIGGSILANLADQVTGLLGSVKIYASVRTEQQALNLAKLGVNVIQLDISNETAVEAAILSNSIDVILHIASSHDPEAASHLIKALGKRRQTTGNKPVFVHTSGTTAFCPEAGWPAAAMKDTEDVFTIEKEIMGAHPIRLTDVRVVEEGEAQGVTTFIVVVPGVYGRGLGECKKLSIPFPVFIRASLKDKMVHQFNVNGTPAAVHITDIAAFFRLLTENILEKKSLPSGKDGYFFPMAHKVSSWGLMERFAERLHAMGLVTEPKPRLWPNDEVAAESLGLPPFISRVLGTHSINLVTEKAYQLGWQPQWHEKKLFENIDEEINAVLEHDGIKVEKV